MKEYNSLCKEEELLLQKIEVIKNKVEESAESNYNDTIREQPSNSSISFYDYNNIKSTQAIKSKIENINSLLSSNNSSLVSPSSSYTTDDVYNYNNSL